MSHVPELDPVVIRQTLEGQRKLGASFNEAWAFAMQHRPAGHEQALYTFMHAHFRSAYDDDTTPKGRCMVPDRDVSNALLMAPPRPAPSSDHERCRSGDQCDRLATRGRFGRMWCEHHATELERISGRIVDARDRANPRKHGNGAIFGAKRKAA